MKKKFSSLGILLVLLLVVAGLGQPQPSYADRERCPPTGCYCTALQGWACYPVGSYHDCWASNNSDSWCICQGSGNNNHWECQ